MMNNDFSSSHWGLWKKWKHQPSPSAILSWDLYDLMDVLGRSQIAKNADSCGKLQSIPHHTPEIEQQTRSYKQVFFFSDWIWHLHVSCGSFLLCHELLAVSAQFKPLVFRVIILAGSHLRSYWLNFLRGLPLDLNKPITSIKIAGNRKEPQGTALCFSTSTCEAPIATGRRTFHFSRVLFSMMVFWCVSMPSTFAQSWLSSEMCVGYVNSSKYSYSLV